MTTPRRVGSLPQMEVRKKNPVFNKTGKVIVTVHLVKNPKIYSFYYKKKERLNCESELKNSVRFRSKSPVKLWVKKIHLVRY